MDSRTDLVTTRRFQVIGSFLLYNRLFNQNWPKLMEEPEPVDHADRTPKPYLTRFRLAVGPWTVHFNNPGYVKAETMHMLEMGVVKKTLEDTRRDEDVRLELGSSYLFWDDCAALLKSAIPSLEKRCFAAPDPATPEYEGLCGPLIASFSSNLLRDLERLNKVVAIARNVLTCGEKVQNLAADRRFDKEIFNLINVAVRVTARGYDGEAGTQDEDKWQSVINAYKKLLITCLQFLNNLVARNEQRKLMLWIELFDSHLENDMPNFADLKFLLPPQENKASTSAAEKDAQGERNGNSMDTFKTPQQPASSPFLLYIGRIGPLIKRALTERGEKAGAQEIAAECKRRWQSMSESEHNEWNMLYADVIAKYRDDITSSSAYKKVVDQHAKNEENVQALAESISQLQVEVDKMRSTVMPSESATGSEAQPSSVPEKERSPSPPPPPPPPTKERGVPLLPELLGPPTAKESDFRVTYAAEFGERLLQKGKNDLMKRLEGQASHVVSPSSPTGEASSAAADADPLSEEEDSEDDYDAIPGDDGRGLLTDVPLILGPTEIEVLPMIIMAGIVPPSEGQPGYNPDPSIMANIRNMHTVRCHLLLAQDNGRNLLRELLIFVAAWDLREEELYFNFMMKIMEAILSNGLMPFAYHAFRETKDIISPAQAVIMKLLTNIFRARQSRTGGPQAQLRTGPKELPMRVDVHMVNFLLTEFRRHIIPQTCGLIYLQGLIRQGRFHPEDFPLNLWDMERMYEGVYQYLEFFAILTETDAWKQMLANWEITSELVTLLKELDAAIPKGHLVPPPLSSNRPVAQPQHPVPQGTEPGDGTAPVAVERPYDTTQQLPPAEPDYHTSPRPYIDEPQDEPADFEWRNLKKLAVLVLSSLVWKNRKVQDQVGTLGGIEAVLNCCNYDENNPYIREHAIMCLRFLLEGNEGNQKRVRELEPRGVVPNEVLDQNGYETFMDGKGHVQLRRKGMGQNSNPASRPSDVPNAVGPALPYGFGQISNTSEKGKGKVEAGSGIGTGMGAGHVPRDPKDLELLVQQVMRELPSKIQGVRGELAREREGVDGESVKKLDRGFDGRG
ncbi:hypothetical protein GQ43DRAFT_484155 [Delitschia confertaspora ATCC 74209]|uniref:Ataxin-10 homolog n=1 Tax=Delitschia confertaspora ATCC 74209 TaxID=1513339 RepID=A0A9P4MNY3_9PLEO|nr:hypothetical protein GQ43DRAFT_484155 [Delitschia confertaspora ATCC 74209]